MSNSICRFWPRLATSGAIAIVFAAAAEYFVGWRSLAYPWRYMADFSGLSFACALLGATYVIRAYRLYRYLRLGHHFDLCLKVQLQHTLLVNLLPFRLGEFAFPSLLERNLGVPIERSVSMLVWLRALDLHALLFIPIVILAAVSPPILALVAAAMGVLWLSVPLLVTSCSGTLTRILSAQRNKPSRILHGLLEATPKTLSEALENWCLTLLNWLVKLAVFAWIIQAFSSGRYVAALSGAIGGELSSALPIQGVAGFGTYEAGVVAGMQTFDIGINSALTGAVNLHLMVLGVSLAGAILSLFIPYPRSPIRAATLRARSGAAVR